MNELAMIFCCFHVLCGSPDSKSADCDAFQFDKALIEILRLDMRAREGVALLGSGFLKLDARAREDVLKLDTQARRDMLRLRHIALGLTETASMELSSAAEEHWSDGALDADLRLADLRARRRAMEDLYAAVLVVKNVHDALVSTLKTRSNKPSQVDASKDNAERGAAEDNQGFRSYLRNIDPMAEGLVAFQDAYWKMASAFVEAEGMECTDPDELEFIVAALLDMEEVDGGSGALLVTEIASSPDVATRLALADALADAPSLWTLGNAGMGALQRLSMDSNPTVAAAATKAINELKSQWRQQDQLIFPYRQKDEDEPEMGL
ncbi:senescence-associated protein AAF, chloroplastic isoform X2 [Physcomitrium patens]|uniref:senescence-associated protein AAF, chloroplastic isoform X2 n=1 Tax=Physcomitrium patens TaxID=3218 RepID=UPI003CCE1277